MRSINVTATFRLLSLFPIASPQGWCCDAVTGQPMSSNVLTFVIVGHDDHPIFESDLAPKPGGREVTVEFAVDTSHTVL